MIQIPAVQTYIVKQYITPVINNTFGTKIKFDKVDINFFGEVRLTGIKVNDEHDSLLISVKELRARPDYFSLVKGSPYQFDKLTLINPKVFIKTYKGESQDNFLMLIDHFSSEGESDEVNPFVLQGAIQVKNGYVEIINENLPPSEQVWVKASKLNLKTTRFKVDSGNIYAKINHLSFHAKRSEKIQSNLEHMEGEFIYRDDLLQLEDLKIKTNHSKVEGQLAFVYKSAQDFSDFYHKVHWKLDLDKGSYVGMKDVQYFVPFWDKYSKLTIEGKIRGAMDRWELNDMKLSTMNTRIEGKKLIFNKIYSGKNFSIQSDNMFATTNYSDLISLLPTNINKDLPKFIHHYGNMSVNGMFFINRDKLKTNSVVQSSTLGKASTNITIKDYSKDFIHYFGTINTEKLNLKTLASINQLGFISGNFNINGYGNNLKTLSIKTTGKISHLDFLGRQIQNIKIDGRINKQIFKGNVEVKDPNLMMNFDGKVDFSPPFYRVAFKSSLQEANLYKLGLSKDPNARLMSDISLDIRASSIDDLLGQILLKNTFYQNSTQSFAFEQMLINSSVNKEGKRLFTFKSDELINGYIEGSFKLLEVLKVSQNAFGKLLTHYAPEKITPSQSFSFNFDIKDYFFEILFPSITLEPGSHLEGEITPDNQLILKAKMPGLLYKKLELGKSNVILNTHNSSFQTSIEADHINLAGYKLDNVKIHSIKKNDTIQINTHFNGNLGGISKQAFDLNLYNAQNEEGQNIIGVRRSTIQYNHHQWVLNPNNEKDTHYAVVDFSKNQYDIQKMILTSGDQKLSLEGTYINKDLALILDLENTRLEALIPPLKNIKLEGLANGNLKINDDALGFHPTGNLKIDTFKYNDYEVGDISAEVLPKNNAYLVNAIIHKNDLNQLTITGNIYPEKKEDYLDLKVKLNDFETAILNHFLVGVVENIRGTVKGGINLKGTWEKPNYQGSVHLKNGGLKIAYLGVDYDIMKDPEILISNGLVYLYDMIYLRDIKHNSKVTLTGALSHKDFLDWSLDLVLDSRVKYDKKYSNEILIMDTHFHQNPLFYGIVYAKDLYATIKGPAANLKINVIATTAPRTRLTINTEGQDLEISKSIQFVNISDHYKAKKAEKKKQNDSANKTRLNLKLGAEVTPEAELELILDEKNDDKIVASGKGNIRLDIDLDGNIAMNGEIAVTRGYYNFAREAIKKVFKIRPNSSLKWTGDIYDTQLDIKAYFEREVSNVADYISGDAQTLKTELEVALSGPLSSPKIDFNVLTPNAPESIRNNLSLKFSDKDEETKQWAALLLLGKFLPPNDTNYITGLTTTAYELAFSQMSSLISNISKYLTVNFGYTEGSKEYNTADRFNMKGKVEVNPRVSINVSGGVSLNNNNISKIDDRQMVAGSAEVDYDISRQNDGSLKLKAFTRPTNFGIENFNATNNYSQAWGVGIYYHEDFNTFKELKKKILKKRRKRKKEKVRLDSLQRVLDNKNSLLIKP